MSLPHDDKDLFPGMKEDDTIPGDRNDDSTTVGDMKYLLSKMRAVKNRLLEQNITDDKEIINEFLKEHTKALNEIHQKKLDKK